jgi:probable addiction module antidote protein
MSDIARESGLSRENLYRSLNGETKTELDTIVRVLNALGIQLSAGPKSAA